MLPLFDRLGNWNPQLLRELKGRLKPSAVILAIVLSGIAQALVLIYSYGQLPTPLYRYSHRYCTGDMEYLGQFACIRDAAGNLLYNWQTWWLDTFGALSLAGSFLLILVGVYLLTQDLSQEEQRGTLNFIRLSPRSTREILVGKLLGVPVALYIGVLLALPLHLWAAVQGQVPVSIMLSFDAAAIGACLLFYSGALLLSLVLPKLGGLQVWLSSGAVLLLLMLLYASNRWYVFPENWLVILNPVSVLGFLTENVSRSNGTNFAPIAWFGLPLTSSLFSLSAALLLHYALLTGWIWAALERRFRTPSATLWSKRQSYGLVVSLEVLLLGFATQAKLEHLLSSPGSGQSKPAPSVIAQHLLNNFHLLLLLNLVGFVVLAILLSPARQSLQDWARYRRSHSRRAWRSLLQDLLFSERSPMLLAMGVNLVLVGVILLAWAATWSDVEYQKRAVLAVLLNAGVTLVCAAIVQFFLNSRLPKRGLWAIGTVSGLLVLPPITIIFAFANTSTPVSVWLFSAVPWAVVGSVSVQTVLLTLLGHFSLFSLFTLGLSQQLRKAGASETKALLSIHTQ